MAKAEKTTKELFGKMKRARQISWKASVFGAALLAGLFVTVCRTHAEEDGYIFVTSQPKYALIYLDGHYVNARTPNAKLIAVTPGKHELQLVRQQYKLFQGMIAVKPGKALEVNVVLSKTDAEEASRITDQKYVEAYISVRSTPPEADVFLDDKRIGATPILNYKIPIGESSDRKLRISKKGYVSYEETLKWADLRDRVQFQVAVELPKAKPSATSVQLDKLARKKKFELNNQVLLFSVLLLLLIAALVVVIVGNRRKARSQ